MGFYGNITNTSKTNFVFDKIYTNRKAMDEHISEDGIFIGRYVLVEYGEITNDSFIRAYGPKEDGYYHISNNEAEATRILYTADKNKVKDRYITNGIVIYTITKNSENEDVYTYYECNGGEFMEEKEGEKIYRPKLSETPGLDIKNDPYFYNFNQDKAVEAYGGTRSRGYDGTVWVKTSTNNKIKYVNIAELNSVVPSFEMVADAPTMSPILPHFDTASNNVYYKLHWQPAWGMRIAETTDGKNDFSDYVTSWSQEVYNKEGEAFTQWYFPEETQEDGVTKGVWRSLRDGEYPPTINADIYFNKAAFDPQIGESNINKDVNYKPITLTSSTYVKGKYYYKSGNNYLPDNRGFNSSRNPYYEKFENYIGITADGLSGNEYNLHDGTLKTEKKPDTQQIHINLPAIGNMMSEAWDIIHGTDRDNYRGNTVYNSETGEVIKTGSLEGRMKAFEEIKANQIPVKRASDGTLIGSKINNATQYSLPPDKDILDESTLEDIPNKFDGDDPWIETEINTSELVGGTKLNEDGQIDGVYDQANNSGISIRHTFHSVKNSKTALDKNSGVFSDKSEASKEKLQKGKLPVTNEDTKNDDTIKLYTPYIDAKGHVVGKNIETITLPYGFKTITATNSTDTDKWSQLKGATSSTNENVKNIVADSTKDTFKFKGGNKWIRFETDAKTGTDTNNATTSDGNNTLTIAHETHDVVTTPLTSDFNKDIKYIKIELTESEYKKGKYYWYNNEKETYEIDNNSTLVSGREHFVINDKIAFQDLKFDTAGHVTDNQIHTYTLPYGFKYFTTNGITTTTSDLYTTIKAVANGDDTETKATVQSSQKSCEANNTQDTLNINAGNKWIQTKITNNTDQADSLVIAHEIHAIKDADATGTNLNGGNISDTTGDNIVIPDLVFDKAGHLTENHSHTYTLPYGYKTIVAKNSDAVAAAPVITTDSPNPTADNTQDTLNLTASNKWIKFNTLDNTTNPNEVQIGHILSPIAPALDPETNNEAFNKNEITCQSTDITIDEFGDTFKILNFKTDNAGHIIAVGENTITLPIGSYTAAKNTTNATEVITSIGFNAGTGAITSTKASTSTLKLDNKYNKQYIKVGKIAQTEFVANTYYVLNGTSYSLATIWGSDVDYYVTNSNYIESGDTINQAFEKVQNQIYNIYGSNKVAESFDTIKEIADFLEQDDNNKQSGVEKIISDISINAQAINAEKTRATSAESNLATNIAAEETRATGAEQTLTTKLSNEITRAKGVESTLNTRITNLVGTTSVSTQIANFGNTLGTAAKSDVGDFAPAGSYDDRVLTSVYEAKIASLEATIAALDARIAALETPVSG